MAVDAIAWWLDWVVRLVNVATLGVGLVTFATVAHHRRVVRRFFGSRSIEVCVPARRLSGRVAVDEADLLALQTLTAFLTRYRVKVRNRFIAPDGTFPLSGDGQVVVCGPKSSQIIARAMASDPSSCFAQDGDSWVLQDVQEGRSHPSPMDGEQTDADMAYIGRVHRAGRPDQRFLAVAGLHAPGSAVAVDHLCDYRVVRELDRLYRGSAFSAIVTGEFRRDPLQVLTTEIVVSRSWTA